MKKKWLLLFILPSLASCANLYNKDITSETPGVNKQLCANLKRNISLNSVSSVSMDKATPTEKAQMIKMYEKSTCSRFEN